MKLAKYLGQNASVLLSANPFNGWAVERIVDEDSDPPEVRYVFKKCGFQLNCDFEDERVNTLFFEKEQHAGTQLSEVPFSLTRDEVLSRFGSPSKSGEGFTDPILGKYGAWDRFHGPEYTLHIQYAPDSGRIEKVTLMRNDVAESI